MVCNLSGRCVSDLARICGVRVLLFLLVLTGPVICSAQGGTAALQVSGLNAAGSVNPVPALTMSTPSQAISGAAATVTLTGTGFVPGTTLTTSVGPATSTYNSPTSLAAQITLPTGAAGNISLQATNPQPGGGTGVAFQLPIATLQETAADPDGTNTGTTRLAVPVNFSAVRTDWSHTMTSWTLTHQ